MIGLWTKNAECKEKVMSEIAGTIGDRILHLLRTGGRADRGVPYEQKDLVAWLNGDAKAPDGNFYHVGTSTSTMSRIINGSAEPPLGAIIAICNMFHTDMEWLATGEVREEPERIERFVTDEANRVGAIVDAVDQDMRDLILHMAEELREINAQRQDLRTEVYTLLTDTISAMSGDNKARAKSVIRKVHSRGVDLDVGAFK